MKVLKPSAVLVLGLMCAMPVFAQPDLSGYWLISFGPIPPVRPATPFEQSLIDQLPTGTRLLADTGLVEFPHRHRATQQNGYPVGGIGDRRVQTEGNHHRKGDRRAA